MGKLSYIFFLVLLLLFSVSIKAQDSSKGNVMPVDQSIIMLYEHDLKWVYDPMGVKVSILQGNAYEKGLYAIRVIFPANWRVAPHWYPNMEVVTVLKGKLYVGIGDHFDENKAIAV